MNKKDCLKNITIPKFKEERTRLRRYAKDKKTHRDIVDYYCAAYHISQALEHIRKIVEREEE